MKHILRGLAVTAACALSACVQMPTEKASIPDLRPQVSFKLADSAFAPARVIVDGLDMGAAGDLAEGTAALRLLPGTHLVRVTFNGTTLLDERVYVTDGVNRTLLLSGATR